MMFFLPLLALAGIVLAYFYPLLDCRAIFVERDLSVFFLPPRILWVKLAKSLTFPFWNSHNYSGIPLLATLQPGVLYPPHILYFFLPFNVAWNWLIILHYLLAGVSMHLLMSHMKASPLGSFIGAVTLMLSGYLLSVHNLVPHLFSVSWFPLIVLQFLKHLEMGRFRHLAWTSLLLAVQFLAGAPEMWLLSLMVLGVMVLFAPLMVAGNSVSWWGRCRGFALIVFLCLLLCSVQLFPFYELKAMSIRRGGLSYDESTIWSFGWRDFIRFFLDDPYGAFTNTVDYWRNESWLKTIYMGAIPFALSLFYFISKDKRRIFFAVLMFLSFLLALGGNTPVHRMLHHIPPFDGIRYPVKFLFLFVFVLSLSTGLGLDSLRVGVERDTPGTNRLVRGLFLLGLAMALLWGFLTFFHSPVSHLLHSHGIVPGRYNTIPHILHNGKRFLLFSFAFFTVLLLYYRKKHRILPYCLASILVLDLFLVNFGYYNAVSWTAYTSNHRFVEPMGGGASPDLYLFSPRTVENLKTFPLDRAAMSSPYASLFGLYSFGGSEVMRVGYHDAFADLILKAPTVSVAKQFFGVGGIRYLVTSYPVSDPDFTLLDTCIVRKASLSNGSAGTADRERVVHLYQYTKYRDRFLFFSKARFLKEEGETAKAMAGKTDLGSELVLHGAADRLIDNGPVTGAVHLISYGTNRVEIESRSDGAGFVYSSETYYPGWKAFVDGKETPIYRADLAFRAVEVAPGVHRIVFRYVPKAFFLGLLVTTMTLTAMAGAICVRLKIVLIRR
jgi:hypothetical protein